MCGIWGYISRDNKIKPDIDKAIGCIGHRGPDSAGIYQNDGYYFGHTRLAIQDLSERANQPMISRDGRYVIIFNGEIYNHFDIRDNDLDGTQFDTTGDTETVLYGYIKYGPLILDKLNGIFVLCIYDKLQDEVFIARDQFGIKPLYYNLDQEKLVFSSELKAVCDYMGAPKAVDVEAMIDYLTFLWSPGEKTPMKGIRKLLPGHYMKVKGKGFTHAVFREYYHSSFNGKYSAKTEAELTDELDLLLQNAVKRQLLSDVPVGFFLSGGLDSTLLVAMARKLYPERKFNCYTIDVEGWNTGDEGFVNDLKYALQAAEHLNVDLSVVKARPDIFVEFDSMIWHLDEPQADLAPLHVLGISKLARKDGTKVLIGGAAGDDLFSGYRRHQMLRVDPVISAVPLFIRKVTRNLLLKFNPQNARVRKLQKFMSVACHGQVDRIKYAFVWMDIERVKKLFRKTSLVDKYDPLKYFTRLLAEIPAEHNRLNQMLYLETRSFLVDHNLNYTDKTGMAVGVEIRVPYLDMDVVRFAEKLPPSLKLKGNQTKYLLKKVAERYLPHNIIYRPKTGFGAPVRQWINNELSPRIDEMLQNVDDIFDREEVMKLVEEVRTGKLDGAYSVLALLAIHSWKKQFCAKKD